jgi:hypothetical protein
MPKAFDAAYERMRKRHEVLCMKPSVSVYGIGFRQISEKKSAFDLMLDGNPYRIDLVSLREMLQRAGRFRPMLLMPFLAGHEFSVDCVALNGELVCAVARRKPSRFRGGANDRGARGHPPGLCASGPAVRAQRQREHSVPRGRSGAQDS